jgi:hypothetical protein
MAVVDVGRTSIVLTEGPALSLKPLIYTSVGSISCARTSWYSVISFRFCSTCRRTTARCTS